MIEPNFFNNILVIPFLNILIAFYKLFLLVKLPGAFGFAIITLTILIRLVLHPFFKQQMTTAKKMQDIKPHLDNISQKHKKDPKKLQAEQMRLYKEAGINPAAGCLFLIIQLPVFWALYQSLYFFFINKPAAVVTGINKILYWPFLKIQMIDPMFLGFNLTLAPATAKNWFYLLIPVLTAVLQYYQVAVSTPSSAKTAEGKPEDKKNNTGDFQSAMQTQMKFIFPLMIGYFSYILPVGLSLYWNIFSLFSIIQYRQMHGKK